MDVCRFVRVAETECLRTSEHEWAMTHTRGRCDGRKEGRERGYYNLHHKLQNAFLFHFAFRFND